MKKIETDSEVREWAKAIVEANGEKFTPLSKGEQFVIARFILGVIDGNVRHGSPSAEELVPEAQADTATESNTATGTESHEEAPWQSQPDSPSGDSVTGADIQKPKTIQVPRFDGLRRSGISVQRAYDMFLDWCKGHPKEGSVMDFSTGVMSRDAAFAYWLCDTVLMEVPVSAT